ncbi:Polyphosphate kinase-2-related protein [Actinobacteria bacterium OV450]|nr:Polyphosphate kinase-2-related protein [Actinobacteria bacterium OV450]
MLLVLRGTDTGRGRRPRPLALRDVLVARFRELVSRSRLNRRRAQACRFGQSLADDGLTVVKVFLRIRPEEQRERLPEGPDGSGGRGRSGPAGIDGRAPWAEYRHACEPAPERCSGDAAALRRAARGCAKADGIRAGGRFQGWPPRRCDPMGRWSYILHP